MPDTPRRAWVCMLQRIEPACTKAEPHGDCEQAFVLGQMPEPSDPRPGVPEVEADPAGPIAARWEVDEEGDLVFVDLAHPERGLPNIAWDDDSERVSSWLTPESARALREDVLLARLAAGATATPEPGEVDALRDEVGRLTALLNEPDPTDFMFAADTEARYQRETWADDATKTDADWFWLIGHLAGKALHRGHQDGTDKLLHRITTIAAAAANWHRSVLPARPAPTAASPEPDGAGARRCESCGMLTRNPIGTPCPWSDPTDPPTASAGDGEPRATDEGGAS